jgi:hypothetical protein
VTETGFTALIEGSLDTEGVPFSWNYLRQILTERSPTPFRVRDIGASGKRKGEQLRVDYDWTGYRVPHTAYFEFTSRTKPAKLLEELFVAGFKIEKGKFTFTRGDKGNGAFEIEVTSREGNTFKGIYRSWKDGARTGPDRPMAGTVRGNETSFARSDKILPHFDAMGTLRGTTLELTMRVGGRADSEARLTAAVNTD